MRPDETETPRQQLNRLKDIKKFAGSRIYQALPAAAWSKLGVNSAGKINNLLEPGTGTKNIATDVFEQMMTILEAQPDKVKAPISRQAANTVQPMATDTMTAKTKTTKLEP